MVSTLFRQKNMTFTHTGQDKTQKKNEKWRQMNRDRGSKKKKNKASNCNIQDSRITWLHVDICFQSKCFLLGDIYIYIYIYIWINWKMVDHICLNGDPGLSTTVFDWPREIRLRLEFSGVLGNRMLRKIRILL